MMFRQEMDVRGNSLKTRVEINPRGPGPRRHPLDYP